MKQAKIIQVCLKNPDKIELVQKRPDGFIPDEALSLLVELNLSKIKYGILRQVLKQKNINVFPSNNLLIEEKTKCFSTDIFFYNSSSQQWGDQCTVVRELIIHHDNHDGKERIRTPDLPTSRLRKFNLINYKVVLIIWLYFSFLILFASLLNAGPFTWGSKVFWFSCF